MTVSTTALRELATWLEKRAQPDSGIRYEAGSHSNTNGVRHRLARVELYGRDADFIAKHFHGKGAADLAAATIELLDRIDRLEAAQRSVPPPLTANEIEKIILNTEVAEMSERGDRIWTRRMAEALRDRQFRAARSTLGETE
jgi:triphosphoribosyl-dephospho-CoA synthetase